MKLPRPIRILFSIYAILVFLLLMFILLPFAIIAFLLPEPYGGRFIYKVVTFWADAAMAAWFMWHRNIYEAPYDPAKNAIFVFNHVSYMDIPVMLKALRKQPIRILGKAEMGKVPIFGIFYRKAVIMVQRDSPQNRAKSLHLLRETLRNGISVAIAPEGTFNTSGKPLKEFYDGAFRIAIETGTNIRPVLFLDTYDRMHYRSVFSMTPGKSRAVFLEEVPVHGYDINRVQDLKQEVYQRMESALIRHQASWVDLRDI